MFQTPLGRESSVLCSFFPPLEPANKLTWPQNAPPSSGSRACQHQSQAGQFCKPGTQAQGSQGPGQGIHAEKDKGALGFYSSGNPTWRLGSCQVLQADLSSPRPLPHLHSHSLCVAISLSKPMLGVLTRLTGY